jgi:hypothetical protein
VRDVTTDVMPIPRRTNIMVRFVSVAILALLGSFACARSDADVEPMTCPDAATIEKIVANEVRKNERVVVRPQSIVCAGDWAYAGVAVADEGCGGLCDSAHAILHFVDGAWTVDHYGGTGPLCMLEDERDQYQHWPAEIRRIVGC